MIQQQRRPSVQLALNGTPIYLLTPIITVSVTREEKDMSGQKSSTEKTDKGVKAKEMTVTGLIPYREKKWLTDLFNFAESVDGKGEQTKYRVSSITAEAVNMREVQFSGEVTAYEQEQALAWQVSFKLREVNSVSEKKEQRKAKPQKKTQTESAPNAPSANPEKTAATEEQTKEDNSFWKKLDDKIGSA